MAPAGSASPPAPGSRGRVPPTLTPSASSLQGRLGQPHVLASCRPRGDCHGALPLGVRLLSQQTRYRLPCPGPAVVCVRRVSPLPWLSWGRLGRASRAGGPQGCHRSRRELTLLLAGVAGQAPGGRGCRGLWPVCGTASGSGVQRERPFCPGMWVTVAEKEPEDGDGPAVVSLVTPGQGTRHLGDVLCSRGGARTAG